MSEKTIKTLRKQIRNVVQDILPEVLSQELTQAVHKQVAAKMDKRLDVLADTVKAKLEELDQRSKDTQSYIIRNTTHVPVVTAPPIPEGTPVASE